MILINKYHSKRKLPVNFVESDLSLFQDELSKEIPPITLVKLHNVNINSGCVVFKRGMPFDDKKINPLLSDNYRSIKGKIKFFLINYVKKKKITLNNDAIWFIDLWSKNYFHWLTDVIPRLISIQNFLKGRTVLLPFHYNDCDYVTNSLSMFKDIDIRFIRDHEVIFCKRLLLTPHTIDTSGNYNDKLIKRTRDFVKANCASIYSGEKFEKIYISRQKAKNRKILNEEEFFTVLRDYGFDILCFEDYSWTEQIGIVRNCKYLCSAHGAGLANMLFMDTNTSVLEFRKKGDAQRNCYFSLTSALDLNYFYQECDVDDNYCRTQNYNFLIDVKLLRNNLELMLNKGKVE
jgi:hypothetical protein